MVSKAKTDQKVTLVYNYYDLTYILIMYKSLTFLMLTSIKYHQ